MKTERLLAIITYLLNRDVVTGKFLAEKYEVSERTIQRDIESINMAGIPIVSLRGINGGYKILDSYRLSKQTADNSDLQTLRIALEGVNSAIDNERISRTLEKVKSLQSDDDRANISVDFGVARENERVAEFIKIIDKAIIDKLEIQFEYVNANNYKTLRRVEPIALKFKWYAWYLVGYCIDKKDYRIFKIARMESLKVTDNKVNNIHDNDIDMFEKLMMNDKRRTIKVIFKFDKNIENAVKEYIDNVIITDEEEGSFIGEFTVVEEERNWFAFLLSFGSEIEVLQPEYLRERIISHSEKILSKYQKPDK